MRAGLIVVALAIAISAAACGSNSNRQDSATLTGTATASPAVPSSTASAPAGTAAVSTPTRVATTTQTIGPTATNCPVPAGLCDFARRTEAQLAKQDVAGVLDGSTGRPVTCTTGINPGLGAEFPLCDGAAPREVRMGFDVGRFQSEGGMVNKEGAAQGLHNFLANIDPSLSDALGQGAIRAFTIGCAQTQSGIDCNSGLSIVFSAIRGNQREFLMLNFTQLDGDRQGVVGTYTGIAELNMEYLTGGAVGGLNPGDPASPRIRYMPIAG